MVITTKSANETESLHGHPMDPKLGFLPERLGKPLFIHSLAKHKEEEIKIIAPEFLLRRIHHAIVEHRDVIAESKKVAGRDSLLVNLGIDIMNRASRRVSVFRNAAHQCRVRIGFRPGYLRQAFNYHDAEIAIKSELTGVSGETRTEIEIPVVSATNLLELLIENNHVRRATGINLDHEDTRNTYIYGIAMTGRAQGSFVHYLKKYGCYVEYMSCFDHTLHTDINSFFGVSTSKNAVVGEDCEAEFEARAIYTATQRKFTPAMKRQIIQESRTILEKIALAQSSNLILSPQSKLGRTLTAIAKNADMGEDEALRDRLGKKVRPESFIGRKPHAPFTDDYFEVRLAKIAARYMISPEDFAEYYLN